MLPYCIIQELCYIAIESKQILEDYLNLLKINDEDKDYIINNSIDNNYNLHPNIIIEYFGPLNISNFCDYVVYSIIKIAQSNYIHYTDHFTFDEFISDMLVEINVSTNTIDYILEYHYNNEIDLDFDKMSLSEDICDELQQMSVSNDY